MPAPNLPEIRHMRSGSLNIAPPVNGPTNGFMSAVPGVGRFDGPRSPPNTSHVPCKFFRQGACQAGNACPFSHDLGHAAETVCKYFSKGNCKFGPKCANIHVLPDGRRVNYGKNGVTITAAPINLGSRVNPATYGHASNSSALTSSFMRGGENVPPYTAASPYAIPADDHRYTHHIGRQPSMENGLPTIDTTYSSNPASVYGSPREDDAAGRFGLGLSPVAKGLSVLDAPLPASFDSNGISHAARYGPWPASVPSKFGLESPSHSLNAAKDGRTSETLKLLHTSAFGSSEHLGQHSIGDSIGFSIGSSPPTVNGNGGHSRVFHATAGGTPGEEYFGRRPMHSSTQRYSKPRLLSSSAPKIDNEWEAGFLFEEDYVPGALANEVLTPAEKARRGSNTHTLRGLEDEVTSGPSMSIGGAASSPLGVNMSTGAKFGSPSMAASPSGWGPLFSRQPKAEPDFSDMKGGAGGSRSMKHAASAFGHVGSPLRNSSLASGIGAEIFKDSTDNSSPAQPGHGSRSGSVGESLSALTLQLRQTSLESEPGVSPHLHPNTARNGGASTIGRERSDQRDKALERHVSSGSIGSSIRFTTPIDEEDPSFLFNMEDDEANSSHGAGNNEGLRSKKQASMGLSAAAGATSSPLGNGWTYASAVAAGKNNGSIGNGSSFGGAVGARDNGSSVGTVGGR